MEIHDYDFDEGEGDGTVKVWRLNLHVISFQWPCTERFDVKRVALLKLLTGLALVRYVDGLRVALAHPEAVRGYDWKSEPEEWGTLALSRERRAHIRATVGTVDKAYGVGGPTALFRRRDLRDATRVERVA